jgi:hypothetical protein
MTTNRSTTRRKAGPNRVATEATLAELGIDPATASLAQLALTLADALDGEPGAQTANLSRELRNTMLRVFDAAPAGPDELDEFMAELHRPVGTDG